ncbi:FAD-dependent oxidoreductase [Dermatophilaceae bacterium Sec6.4]
MGTTPRTVVIIGAGRAGAAAAEALRAQGFDGQLTLVGDEGEHPYDRPPLSKDYLQGLSEKDKVFLQTDDWYAAQDIDLRVDTTVTAIDRARHQVSTADGANLLYDRLLLATGSSPRRLQVPGADLDGLFYLRTLDDCEALRAAFATAHRVAIIGAGWIGLETAAAAVAAGCEVTVIERSDLPLLRVLGRELAQIYTALHRAHGVQFRLAAPVAQIAGTDGRASGVQLQDGTVIEADAIIVGIGIAPNIELAQAAGLGIDNGVLVDEYLSTNDPDIFAAGDVANAYYPHLRTHLRLEHWHAAIKQGPVAATNMLGGKTPYAEVPYFFSDQYEMGMEYCGYVGPDGYDELVFRGEVATGEYLAFWLGNGRVLAGMNVNIWDQTDAISDLVHSGAQIDRSKLVNPDVPLNELHATSTRGARQ